ncbi:uncharacterized protein MYCFIDRAFT_75765 [Pseudocercospora fijiensis CIRAD86]|uniref:Glycosyl transferase CAP10 domain-containing protein n=1 Tax=Pseudocercospora fijiensis (strain CIRAD86) TaxID=383855 RepID=N1QAH2_PSEFD|nr:uncharacterized protein MYCFIDRAFT_75765 [Pseudocercospora fijiensis CIRAD86]EME87933.1 hypothetical protein MYCFIDRAFT_75765 [Pseudocercospora fijiensis CIRAD86]
MATARIISWKSACCLLLSLLSLQFVLLYSTQSSSLTNRLPSFGTSNRHDKSRPPGSTVADLELGTIDAFTATQCNQTFPHLYRDIERAVRYWKDRRHTLTPQDVDISWRNDGALRILIVENELRILETKGTFDNTGYRVRIQSILHLIQRALWSATIADERLPTVEAAIVVDDMSSIPNGKDTHSVWTWTSLLRGDAGQKNWLIPDFGMFSAPATGSFLDTRRRAAQHDSPFTEKIPKAFWRGVRWTNEAVRGALLEKTKGQEWADAAVINWASKTNIISADEMCKYAFLIHTEGRSYSGRLQFLLNCDSLPILHELEWNAHFYHLLKPDGDDQNYISVKRDFSDLQSKVEYYLKHPDEAQRIIANSINTFRNNYTSPAATSCYLRRLIREYSTVAFTPDVKRSGKQGEGTKRRGISFEEWIHLRGEYNEDA